jgi:hypothetical protein
VQHARPAFLPERVHALSKNRAPQPKKRRPFCFSGAQKMKEIAQHAGCRAPDEESIVRHGIKTSLEAIGQSK